MATPKIDVFVTSIQSNAQLRGRHERTQRALTSVRVPFTTHDVASDEEAKKYWKRKNQGSNELPCVLVDGERVGSIEQLDEAVEFGELRQFLRLDKPAAAPPASTNSTTPNPSTSSTTAASLDSILDEFSDLNLTPAELASLEAELASSEHYSSPGYHPSSSDFSHTFTPTAPLSFGPGKNTVSVSGKGKDRVEVVRASGAGRIADTEPVELDLEGLGLSEEEARKIAKELGLLDDDVVFGAKGEDRPAPPSKVEEEPMAHVEVPREAEVEKEELTPSEISTVQADVAETGSKLNVQPISQLEKDAAKHPLKELPEPPKRPVSSGPKEKVKKEASKATQKETEMPEYGEMYEKVAAAIQDGAL
ncbi:hypothetical protein MNV49_002833 [Pseudohyphozyma bogoriensis]|nr:hypothetical protein MNV49_002833 [Pseudohyphozyma bogoriensis]